jgi:ABC-type xylose transport system, periplasmic component
MLLPVAMLVVSACGTTGAPQSTGAASGSPSAGGTIALLLPEVKTARYEQRDKPAFEAKVKELCATCRVIYANANQDAAAQQTQAESALANGATVLVLDPVDSTAAASIVAAAKAKGAKVISYDRVVLNADIDYVVKNDNVQQGVVQAQALVDKLKKDGNAGGTIVMINGSASDANSKPLKEGAHSIIDKSGLAVAAEFDTPDWSPDKAQQEMEQAITALGKDKIVGVYSANDGMASGAIAAMKSAGMVPVPPITGLDAELAAVQRIVVGDQFMTAYLNVEKEAAIAAQMAVALATGQPVPADLTTGSINNGQKDVPGSLLSPVAVDLSNLKQTVIDSGYLTADKICVVPYADACKAAGLTH